MISNLFGMHDWIAKLAAPVWSVCVSYFTLYLEIDTTRDLFNMVSSIFFFISKLYHHAASLLVSHILLKKLPCMDMDFQKISPGKQ